MSLEVDPNFSNLIRLGIRDPFDITIDPETSPWDVNSARFYSEGNIFKPLNDVMHNPRFDKDARVLLGSEYQGNVGKNSDAYKRKMERILAMGYYNTGNQQWGTDNADSLVKLTYHCTHIWDEKQKQYIKYYVVRADDKHILRAAPHKDVFGVDFWLLESWAEDLEGIDYWSDGIGDIVRVPNKAINTWISQYMENRTLASFGMNLYDSTNTDFKPSEFDAKAWAWYPLPGKPNDVYKRLDIPELKGTLQDIQFVVNMAERASATGSLEKGAVEDVKRTLGEVEIAVSNALERTNDIAPLYNSAYERIAEKWYHLVVANMAKKNITLYKENPDEQVTSRTITAQDIHSKNGYEITSEDKAQADLENVDEITRLRAGRELFPNNAAMRKAEQRRFVRLLNLTPQEVDEIEQEEVENAEQQLQTIAQPSPYLPQAPTPQLASPQSNPQVQQPGLRNVI